jgi:hypothetical protein
VGGAQRLAGEQGDDLQPERIGEHPHQFSIY